MKVKITKNFFLVILFLTFYYAYILHIAMQFVIIFTEESDKAHQRDYINKFYNFKSKQQRSNGKL